MITLDETDLAIMRATQAGLPLTPEPYQHIAEQLGLTAEVVMTRMAPCRNKALFVASAQYPITINWVIVLTA